MLEMNHKIRRLDVHILTDLNVLYCINLFLFEHLTKPSVKQCEFLISGTFLNSSPLICAKYFCRKEPSEENKTLLSKLKVTATE
jgi:hypothetical protein